MRFIELISERGMEDAFENKHAAVMTTSIHYYDHHAHNYMRAVCEDISMKFVDAISLDIIDMMEEERRREMIVFAEGFFIYNYEIFVKNQIINNI